jgi:hypothetical protein
MQSLTLTKENKLNCIIVLYQRGIVQSTYSPDPNTNRKVLFGCFAALLTHTRYTEKVMENS